MRSRTHPWGIDPAIYLEEIRQRSRINKSLSLRESLANMAHSTSLNSSHIQKDINEITHILDNLKSMRAALSPLSESETEFATQCAGEITVIITNLLLRVVNQIGQTNVLTPTLESILAYIRSLMHTRSEHMRQTIPGHLLMAWYDLSNLMTSMQNEPELRITNRKARQLVNLAIETATWTYKHLTTELVTDGHIGFVDRINELYTYE